MPSLSRAEIRESRGGKLTESQELFARALALGVDLVQAYLDAGYQLGQKNNAPSQIRHKAALLLKKPHVSMRVAELRNAAVEPAVHRALAVAATSMVLDHVERRRWVHDQLQIIATRATDAGDYGSALDALRMIGADVGMWAGQGDAPAAAGMSRAAVQREAAQVGAAAGAAAGIVAHTDIMSRLERARGATAVAARILDVTPTAPALAAAAE